MTPLLSLMTLMTLLLMMTVMTDAARILAVVPSCPRSHHVIIQAVLRTLAGAGHDVTVYSVHPLANPPPNYTDISLGPAGEIPYTASRRNWNCLEFMLSRHSKLMERTFENENIKRLLNSDEKFDLIITEPYHGQEFTLMFGHKFKAPTIGIHTYTANTLVNLHMGNAFSVSHIPQMCYPHTDEMSLWQRLVNGVALVDGIYSYYVHHLPNVERKMREYFPDMPPLLELVSNLSLTFVNEHSTMDYTQPRPPTIVPIAGVHIEPEKPLPKDFKDFMDSAPDGVILLSLGSVINDEAKPQTYFTSIANAFKKLPQRVIWKTGRENIPGLPENVMLVKWMPQRDILAHPNCVLFMNHGGSGGYYEAIHAGVPVVGIPHFADQHRNVAFYVARGVGVRILPEEVTEDTVTAAVRTVLGDPRYKENMRRLSRVFRDTVTSPRQAVVYWTDYVIRHRGAAHLKPSLARLTWYQRTLIDVMAFGVSVFIAGVGVVYVAVRTTSVSCRKLKISSMLALKKMD